MTPTLAPPPFAVRPLSAAGYPWADVWLRSDLVGVSVTLVFCGVLAVSFGLYLVVDMWAGLFVGQLLFPLALLGPLGFLFRCGRQRETTAGIQVAPAGAHRRVLVLANGGLEHAEARAELLQLAANAEGAMIIAPVAPASWLHALADDFDGEIQAAQRRVDAVVGAFRLAGVHTNGKADVALPAAALIDGLREFGATEILVFPSGGKGWTKANTLAKQIRSQLSPSVEVADPRETSSDAA
jgi:hypothetical protein